MAIIASLSKSTWRIFAYILQILLCINLQVSPYLHSCPFAYYVHTLLTFPCYLSFFEPQYLLRQFLVLLDCIKYCSFPNVVVLLTITASSLSSFFLANVSSNVSFSFSISLTFFINILLISF